MGCNSFGGRGFCRRRLADAWGADLVDLGFSGHINVASGFGPWPAALGLRDALAAPAGQPVLPRASGVDRRASA